MFIHDSNMKISGGPDNPLNVEIAPMTDSDALPTRQAGTTAFLNGAVTVGSVYVELKVAAAPMVGRLQMIVYPPAAGTIYWGASGVTAGSGAPLAAGSAPLAFAFDPRTPLSIYAISDGTNRDIKVVEAK